MKTDNSPSESFSAKKPMTGFAANQTPDCAPGKTAIGLLQPVEISENWRENPTNEGIDAGLSERSSETTQR